MSLRDELFYGIENLKSECDGKAFKSQVEKEEIVKKLEELILLVKDVPVEPKQEDDCYVIEPPPSQYKKLEERVVELEIEKREMERQAERERERVEEEKRKAEYWARKNRERIQEDLMRKQEADRKRNETFMRKNIMENFWRDVVPNFSLFVARGGAQRLAGRDDVCVYEYKLTQYFWAQFNGETLVQIHPASSEEYRDKLLNFVWFKKPSSHSVNNWT